MKQLCPKIIKLLPILLLFTFLPLTVKMKYVPSRLSSYPWYPSSSESADFFLYYRGIFFLILVVWMILVLLFRLLSRPKFRTGRQTFWIPLLIYGVLTFFSFLHSDYPLAGCFGIAEQMESVWILLGYGICTLYCALIPQTKNDWRLIFGALGLGIFLQCLLGIFQLLGADLFNTSLGKFLLVPDSLSQYRDTLRFTFSDDPLRSVYMALYNPNYVGSYVVLFLPLCLSGMFFFSRWKWRIGSGILSFLLLLCLVFSGSKAGMFSLFFLALLVFVLSVRRFPKIRNCAFAGFFLLFFLLALYDMSSGHRLVKGVTSVFSQEQTHSLTRVSPEKDGVSITYQGETYLLSVSSRGEISIEDQKGRIHPSLDGLTFQTYTEGQSRHLVFTCRSIPWDFLKTAEGYQYCTIYGKTDQIEEAESIFPSRFDKAFTNRGYIWGRTIPLLKDTLFLGTGPDTFPFVFPQDDYLARSYLGKNFFSQILTKPHSFYLQTALQTGVLSLLSLFLFWKNCLCRIVRTCKKSELSFKKQLLLAGFFLGILGYLLTGLINDSSLCVAPLFWGVLGLSLSACRTAKNC